MDEKLILRYKILFKKLELKTISDNELDLLNELHDKIIDDMHSSLWYWDYDVNQKDWIRIAKEDREEIHKQIDTFDKVFNNLFLNFITSTYE